MRGVVARFNDRMAKEYQISHYTIGEEIANSITHGIGLVLAIGGAAILAVCASRWGNVWHIVGCSIFAATLVLLYLASTLYHWIQRPRAKMMLQLADHAAIFLLIAGTYTPFTLVNMRGPWGWTMFGIIWGLAVLGIAFQAFLLQRWSWVVVALYVIMGWTIVIAIKPLLASVALGGILLLVLGGLAYTAGIGFYAWNRLPFNHAVWHLFVIAGSVFHFFAVLYYVIPIGCVV